MLFIILLMIFCAATVVVGLMRVYHIADAYEQSVPDAVVRTVLADFHNQNLSVLLSESDFPISSYETEQVVHQYISSLLPGGWEQIEAVKKSQTHYDIVAGSRRLASLSLKRFPQQGQYHFDRWEVDSLSFSFSPSINYTVTAPDGIEVLLNGRPLSADLIVDNAVEPPRFGNLPQDLLPALPVQYKLPGLLAEPSVTASSPWGGNCQIEKHGNSISVLVVPDDLITQPLSLLVERAAKAYANYITNDAQLEDVLPYFLPGTDFYTHIRQFYNGWYNEHDSYSFSNVNISEWSALDLGHLSCTISFDYSITMGRRTFDYPSRYTVYLVHTSTGWKISNLVIL